MANGGTDEPERGNPANVVPAPPTIGIVDDTPTNVELVESIPATETLVASGGPAAFAVSRAEQPDPILLDVVMPGDTSFEAGARLKSDPPPPTCRAKSWG